MAHKNHYHPDKPLDRPMTAAQIDLLRRVVKTNGGGVNAYGESDATIEGLFKRHMVQGKGGDQARLVHTREGLDWVRKNPA